MLWTPPFQPLSASAEWGYRNASFTFLRITVLPVGGYWDGVSDRMSTEAVVLKHREYGSAGPALVLLHGLFGSSANWGSIARELAANYRVIVPDLRNHGQSPHTDSMDYPAMAGDLWTLLERLDVARPLLVGHSMGGKVVMHAALARPGETAAIGVVDIAPVAYAHDFSTILDGLASIELARLRDRAEADRRLAAFVESPAVRAFLLQNLAREGQGWRWRLNLPALRAAMPRITGFEPPTGRRYHGPAHFIHGQRSDYVRPEYAGPIRALFPAASWCEVAAAGHWVYAEQRAGFMRCLRALLRAASV